MEKNKLGTGILIGLLISLFIALIGFIIYDKVLINNNNEQVEQDNNTDNSVSNNNGDIELNYEIIPISDELFKYAGKLSVNNKDTGLVSASLDKSDINKLSDALIVEINDSGISSSIYVIDKDANIINEFIMNSYSENINKNHPYIILRGELDSYTVNANDVYIKGHIGQDDEAVACSNSDDYIIEYTEKFTYLGNGKFATPTIINPITVKEYKKIKNIECK